jgi:hypothetical protein
MPARYKYECLEVMCLKPQQFDAGKLRQAVEYLKTVPGVDDRAQKWIGLCAHAHVTAGDFKLFAKPMLKLSEILGKTPAEVWRLFDDKVTEQRKGLISRGLGSVPVNWDEYL